MDEKQQLALARVAALYPILHVMVNALKLEHPGEIRMAIISKAPDGTGHVGPSWEIDQFLEDIKILAGE